MVDISLSLCYTIPHGGNMQDYKEILRKAKEIGVARYIKETCLPEKDAPLFNLTDEDDEDTVSLKRLFLKYYMDPTEVSFVDNELGGRFTIWTRLKKNATVKKAYKEWLEEAKARFLAERYKQIDEIAQDNTNKARFQALKYLSDKGYYEETESKKTGRPTKEEKEGAIKEFLHGSEEIKQAFERAYENSVN